MARQRYWPRPAARALARQRSRLVGVVVFDISNPFFSHVANLMDQEVQAAGNSLMLVGAREPITTICCSTGSAASAGAENEAKRDRESARGAGRKGMERGMRRFPSCCCFDGRQS